MSTQPFRLPAGGDIDRSTPVVFKFNGRSYQGFDGDTLASALLANGVRLVGRSFKYHRPRGVVTAGSDEPNALVQLRGRDDEPNVRATTLRLRPGLDAHSVNCWPSVGFDVGALNGYLAPLFAAGFYYKTFMWPPGGWNFYARFIRRMAGLGKAPERPGEHCYERRFHHCDVLVIGAGPSGLCAAVAAARCGARVTLVDERSYPGGALCHAEASIDSQRAQAWVERMVGELDSNPNVSQLRDSVALGYYDHNLVTVLESRPSAPWLHERLWKIRASQVVLATGALERPLVFANNDRPGVMLMSAATDYIRRFAVRPGSRAVVVTDNDSAYARLHTLREAKVEVAAFLDTRTQPPDRLAKRVADYGIEVLRGYGVVDVVGTRSVGAVDVAPLAEPRRWCRIACDLVLMSGGWNPSVHLHSQSGGKPRFDAPAACFVPGESVQAECSVGAAAGDFTLTEALSQGTRAGVTAAHEAGFDAVVMEPPTGDNVPYTIDGCWALPALTRHAKRFVDFQNDVTVSDIEQADREGFGSVEHVKRYTTAGMGTDQGKLGNANVIGLLANARHVSPESIGTTTYRPPYTPISFGVIAANDTGERVLPSRRTAITGWFERHGAVMFEAGSNYRRPSYFPIAGETAAAAIEREALHCRQRVGIYDGSPLGKLELQGPDVVAFLNRIYANRFDDLEVGHGRFGWMLREDGRLLDDGVTFRLHADRYLMFVGTGAANHVYMHLERLLQLEWPTLRVFVTPVTSQWTNICVCGPDTRELLDRAGIDINLDATSVPFMSIKEARVSGIPVHMAKLGYTGELSFELNVRAGQGLDLWEHLVAAGEPLGLTLVGSEASMVMRCEKGFVSAGFEGDGMVNPFDAGLGWAVDMDKGDFIGRRSLLRDRHVGGIRPQVVGLLPEDPNFVPADGTPLTHGRDSSGQPQVAGYISQAVFSPNVGRSIALAVLDDGRNWRERTVTVHAIDRQLRARVTRPCFIDPGSERMRG